MFNNSLHLISHHKAEVDKLDFQSYADTICEILTNMRADQTGLTVGIFGDWGSGKSTLLGMVKKKLELQSKKRWLIVEFDAWQYGKQEEVWIGLLRKIVLCVEHDLWFFQKWIINFRVWSARINTRRLWNAVFIFVLRLIVALVLIYFIPSIVGFFIDQIHSRGLDQQFSDAIKEILELSLPLAILIVLFFKAIPLLLKVLRLIFSARLSLPPALLRPSLDNDQPIVADQFRAEFAEMIRRVGRFRSLVVLIDDLDRAPANQIVPVLEAIKHFGAQPPMQKSTSIAPQRLAYTRFIHKTTPNSEAAPITFVLAANRDAVERAVTNHYNQFWATDVQRYAREYLEKIVQHPFDLPPLSATQLQRLIEEGSGTTNPPPQERLDNEILTIPTARWMARDVFIHGSRANPRQVIQAYNMFQSFWLIRQDRKLSDIQPVTLATLTLIHYTWPEEFARFFRYPELFFDLHALATKKPNEYCQETEIDELLTLRCPVITGTVMIEEIARNKPDLLSMLGGSLKELPDKMTIKQLYQYLTLIEEADPSAGRHLVEAGTALLSGDPTLIKFVAHTPADSPTSATEVQQEWTDWLLAFLDFASPVVQPAAQQTPADSARVSEQPGTGNQPAEKSMISAIFALGRLGDDRAVDFLVNIVSDIKRDSAYAQNQALITRAVYALAHLGARNKNPIAVQDILSSVLGDDRAPLSLRLRVLRLLRTLLQDLSSTLQAQQTMVRLALGGQVKYLRDMALTEVKRGGWLKEAIDELDAATKRDDNMWDSFLQIINSCARTPSSTSHTVLDQAYSLMGVLSTTASPSIQQRMVTVWFNIPDSAKAIDYLARLALTDAASDLRKEALEKMAARQREIDWQEAVWSEVQGKLQELDAFYVLSDTHRTEALNLLQGYVLNEDRTITYQAEQSVYESIRNLVSDAHSQQANPVSEEQQQDGNPARIRLQCGANILEQWRRSSESRLVEVAEKAYQILSAEIEA